ncbi:MAG: ribulose-phosphate 3-epimerase [Armatimonadota bacterium]|nr:ribulose-phosphate 3-epimerase [Armatimonadota bacterium]MDR7422091.1 ribulose-phosphate 3-epimerase [Armatimonadota bacterium]MDR7453408.1 ribulose-phosphate 3-epimerase [Armatimonadota bacterium]MDR7456253.1 ribulose-phosphate 3-epimerase [Armatimonadota bacterium]MDR7497624.1 ribulose-phosphate 3-epimerase [Armatimonadota bacterium]
MSGAPGRAAIAASVLSADFAALGEAVRAAQRAGADRVHVDVMDGHFVPPITMGPVVVEALRRATALPLDVHLMVEHPERHIEAFARAGASTITVHVEAAVHVHRVLGAIRALGLQAGVALNPGTPADAVAALADVADGAVVMSVNPGYAGQAFIASVLPKIGRLRTLLPALAWVAVDGGISPATAPAAVAAGADVLVAASAIFRAPEGIEAAVARLRAAAGA